MDAANILISDDKRVGTVLLVMAKLGLMEWVPAKQNLRPVTAPTGLHMLMLFCTQHPLFDALPLTRRWVLHVSHLPPCAENADLHW